MTSPSLTNDALHERSGDRNRRESVWNRCLAELGLASADLLAISEGDDGRTYFSDGVVYKLRLRERSSSKRAQTLAGEYDLLERCRGCYGVPVLLGYRSFRHFDCLLIGHFPGRSLSATSQRLSIGQYLQLLRAALAISLRGVAHNDIRAPNVLISSDNRICLIDFDQARIMPVHRALARNFVGRAMAHKGMFGSCISVAKSEIRKRVPAKFVRSLKRLTGRQSPAEKLPVLRSDADSSTRAMYKAWDIAQVSSASAPGTQLAYYSYDYGGYHFPGERSWAERWAYLRNAADYRGKRILELGCNMGLLSSTLLKEAGVSAAMGVDVDADILRAAQLVAATTGVKPEFKQVDFDSPHAWEDTLSEFKPDLVFALNVLNWVKDKERLMSFLARFPEVVYEGHDDVATEVARFTAVGFKEVKSITHSERGRPVLSFGRK